MSPYTIIQKKVGETPLQALERFRASDPSLADVALAYAGRLDPMASGALLILIGDECKKVAEYNNADKTYTFEILIGFQSDTGDVLGLAEACDISKSISGEKIEEAAAAFVGIWHMRYPLYSSKPVKGKPLFLHMYDGTIGDIEIPTKEVNIYHILYKGRRTLSGKDLYAAIEEKINLLQLDPNRSMPGNDFRKEKIRICWQKLLQKASVKHRVFDIVECEAYVSAGTYIRALAPAIADKLGTCGLAFAIHRESIDV